MKKFWSEDSENFKIHLLLAVSHHLQLWIIRLWLIQGRVPVLPLIDEEIRIDTSEQTSKIETKDMFTTDKVP